MVDFYELLGNADKALEKEQYKKALKYYQEALTRKKNYSPALAGKGMSLWYLGKNDTAMKCFNTILKKEPGHLDSLHFKGHIHQDQIEYEKAIKTYEEYLGIDPDNSHVLTELGKTHWLNDELEKAMTKLKEAQFLDETDEEIDHYIGHVFMDSGKYEEAQKLFQQILSPKDPDPHYLHYIGNTFFKRKMYNEAVSWYDKSIKIEKEPEVITSKGKAQEMLGNRKQAEILYREALKISKNKDEDALAAMGNLLWDEENEESLNYFKKLIKINDQGQEIPKESSFTKKEKIRDMHLKADLDLLINSKEGSQIEFKSSMLYPHNKSKEVLKDQQALKGIQESLKKEIILSINAFLNTDGGNLLIGIDNEGKILGIESDYKFCKNNDLDGWKLKFNDLIKTNLKEAHDKRLIKPEYVEKNHHVIAIIRVKKSDEPVWIKETEFYVRVDASSETKTPKASYEYSQHHWK